MPADDPYEPDLERGIMPTPRSYTTLRDSQYAFIYVISATDTASEARRKLQIEWDSVPLVNPKFDEYEGGGSDPMQRFVLVFISGFFTDGTDLVYMIEGQTDISKFWLGASSGNAYDRPCFATPVTVYDCDEIVTSPGLQKAFAEEVSRTDTKGLKWKHHYESGLKAWSSLVFSPERFELIKQADGEYLREVKLRVQKIALEEEEKEREKEEEEERRRPKEKEEEKKTKEEEGSDEGEVRIREEKDMARLEERTKDRDGDET